MANYYQDVIVPDSRFQSVDRISDLDLLEPAMRASVVSIVSAALPRVLGVFETYRSNARQRYLFSIGESKLQNVGVHHFGLAADLVVLIDGQWNWKVDYSFLGPLAKAAGLVWGGDWAEPGIKHHFVDSDHVQRVTLKQEAGLLAGTWYPEET